MTRIGADPSRVTRISAGLSQPRLRRALGAFDHPRPAARQADAGEAEPGPDPGPSNRGGGGRVRRV